MNCKYCGAPIQEGDAFCPHCGHPVDQENPQVWYYVKDSQSTGPYSEKEMRAFLEQKDIDEETYVWKDGMASSWVHLKDTELNDNQKTVPPFADSGEEKPEEWYYIDDKNEQKGPYNKTNMISYLNDHTIRPSTYVWKTGMKDWQQVKMTNLISYMHISHTAAPVKSRNIALAVLFSIITFGIYYLYWLYSVANDANTLSESQGSMPRTRGGLVVLFTILTLGIYQLYFYFVVSKQLSKLTYPDGTRVDDNAIVNLLFSIFGLSIVSIGILQNTINEYVRMSF